MQRGGCCGALTAMLFLLGLGAGAEFFMSNMHKYDEDLYEQYLAKSIAEQVTQLQAYLVSHPHKFDALKLHLEEDDELPGEDRAPGPKEEVDVSHLLNVPLNLRGDYAKFGPSAFRGQCTGC